MFAFLPSYRLKSIGYLCVMTIQRDEFSLYSLSLSPRCPCKHISPLTVSPISHFKHSLIVCGFRGSLCAFGTGALLHGVMVVVDFWHSCPGPRGWIKIVPLFLAPLQWAKVHHLPAKAYGVVHLFIFFPLFLQFWIYSFHVNLKRIHVRDKHFWYNSIGIEVE